MSVTSSFSVAFDYARSNVRHFYLNEISKQFFKNLVKFNDPLSQFVLPIGTTMKVIETFLTIHLLLTARL